MLQKGRSTHEGMVQLVFLMLDLETNVMTDEMDPLLELYLSPPGGLVVDQRHPTVQ